MTEAHWLVTPYFFDEYDIDLAGAVPDGASAVFNSPAHITDRRAVSLAVRQQPIAQFVKKTSAAGRLPVSIAGDCLSTLGVMAGLQAAGHDPVLVWLDAHADYNVPETSPSGFLGGMPLAMMVGRGDLSHGESVGLTPVQQKDVWLVGARDLDPPEAEALKASQIRQIGVEELAQLKLERPVYLHIDNDVVCPEDTPANNYTSPGGLRLTETLEACQRFASQNDVVALSLSGWNGKLDGAAKTRRNCQMLMGGVAQTIIDTSA